MRKVKATADDLSNLPTTDDEHGIPNDRRVILTVNRVDQILQVARGAHRIEAVLTPPAQSATLHEVPTSLEWDYNTFLSSFHQLKSYWEKIAFVFSLQFEGACRISEILSITWRDIDKLGRITINSKKGGKKRVISAGLAVQYLVECFENKIDPFADLSRHFVYRTYKKFGIGAWFGDNVKMSVTHAPRHFVALASNQSGRDIDLTKEQLGQKSVKSTEHYVKPRRGNKK